MGRTACKQSACAWIAKASSDRLSRLQPDHPEARHQQWMTRQERNRTEYFGSEFRPVLDEGAHELVPCRTIAAERSGRCREIAMQQHCGAIVQGMRESGGRVNPLQAVIAERQRRKEWRRRAQG